MLLAASDCALEHALLFNRRDKQHNVNFGHENDEIQRNRDDGDDSGK